MMDETKEISVKGMGAGKPDDKPLNPEELAAALSKLGDKNG